MVLAQTGRTPLLERSSSCVSNLTRLARSIISPLVCIGLVLSTAVSIAHGVSVTTDTQSGCLWIEDGTDQPLYAQHDERTREPPVPHSSNDPSYKWADATHHGYALQDERIHGTGPLGRNPEHYHAPHGGRHHHHYSGDRQQGYTIVDRLSGADSVPVPAFISVILEHPISRHARTMVLFDGMCQVARYAYAHLVVRPLARIYMEGPGTLNWGFWYGADAADVCMHITGGSTSADHWARNPQECFRMIERRFNALLIVFENFMMVVAAIRAIDALRYAALSCIRKAASGLINLFGLPLARYRRSCGPASAK